MLASPLCRASCDAASSILGLPASSSCRHSAPVCRPSPPATLRRLSWADSTPDMNPSYAFPFVPVVLTSTGQEVAAAQYPALSSADAVGGPLVAVTGELSELGGSALGLVRGWCCTVLVGVDAALLGGRLRHRFRRIEQATQRCTCCQDKQRHTQPRCPAASPPHAMRSPRCCPASSF